VGAMIFAALLLVGSLLYLNDRPVLAGVGLGLALLTALWVLRG